MTPEQAQRMNAESAKSFVELVSPGGAFEIGQETWPQGFPGKERSVTARCFVKGPRTLREYFDRQFLDFLDRDFIVFHDERLTYREVQARVSALGAALSRDYGVQAGDRVACAMRNSPEWCITVMATVAIGAVAVPTNSWWQMEELEYGLKDSGSKVLICDDLILERIGPLLEGLGVRAILSRPSSSPPAGVEAFHDVLARHQGAPCPPCSVGTDDVALIMYTSGTTGNPKGVVLTHRGICNQMTYTNVGDEARKMAMEKVSGAGAGKPRAAPVQECMICPVPLFHVTASHHIFLACLIGGKKLVLMEKWDAGAALKLIERERATSWTGVPTMVRDLMEHPDFASTDTSSLLSVGGGGAPTPPSQMKQVGKKFKGGPSQGYGLTETNGGMAVNQGASYFAKPESTGQPFPFMEVAIADLDSGKPLPGAWQRGELLIRGPLNFSHYWRNEKATREAIVELEGRGHGWFRSGDIAELDEDGFIYIRDRAKDIIIRGGENISCAEVEAAFFAVSPGVQECACFGIKDARLGEVVGLMVYMKPGERSNAAQLLEAVKGRLATFKVPSEENIFFSEEPLPRGNTGKTLKRAIRDAVNKELEAGTRVTHRSKL